MKAKKINKKLVLNKTTVSNLNHNAMNGIKAGQLGTSHADPTACQTQETCECTTEHLVCYTQGATCPGCSYYCETEFC